MKDRMFHSLTNQSVGFKMGIVTIRQCSDLIVKLESILFYFALVQKPEQHEF